MLSSEYVDKLARATRTARQEIFEADMQRHGISKERQDEYLDEVRNLVKSKSNMKFMLQDAEQGQNRQTLLLFTAHSGQEPWELTLLRHRLPLLNEELPERATFKINELAWSDQRFGTGKEFYITWDTS